MENIIELTSGSLRCKIGKAMNGFVNVATYFRPLNMPILLLELEDSESVEYLSNVAYYGENLGALAVKLKDGKNEDDLQKCLQKAMDLSEEQSFVVDEFLDSIDRMKSLKKA